MKKEKRTVTCLIITDGVPGKRYEEKRMVYTMADGSEYVSIMGNKKPVVNGVYEYRFKTLKAETTEDVLAKIKAESVGKIAL